MNRNVFRACAGAACLLAAAALGHAGPIYNFYKITDNAPENIGGQLSVEIVDATTPNGPQQVDFIFRNAVGIASSITDVYFDDGTLLSMGDPIGSAGVSFTRPATPGDLPSGNLASPPFVATQGFSADSEPPVESNGVDAATESLTIRFNLINGQTYANTLAAIALGGADGGLRIGLHVQAIGAGGQSDSYINRTVVPLPVTAEMGLALLGTIGVAGYVRRRKESQQY